MSQTCTGFSQEKIGNLENPETEQKTQEVNKVSINFLTNREQY
jgi:hypothetical protein